MIEIEVSAICHPVTGRFGREHVGMLTFSSCGGENRTNDMAEFARRFDSFNANCLAGVFECWLAVIQRHRDGAPHCHMIVVHREALGGPMYFRKDQKAWWCNATKGCQGLWGHFTPERMGAYGLGVARLHPIRDADAAGAYVARYVSRELGKRRPEDRGARLVRYSQSWPRVVVGPFSWADWRVKQARDRAEEAGRLLWGSFDRMRSDVGPCYKFHLRRLLYCSRDTYRSVLMATEHDLEYFGGPRFALDAQWALLDKRVEESKKLFPWLFVGAGGGSPPVSPEGVGIDTG